MGTFLGKIFRKLFKRPTRPVVAGMTENEFWRSERGRTLIAVNERKLREEMGEHERRGPASDDPYDQLRFHTEGLRIVARYRQIMDGREYIRRPVQVLS